MLYRLADLASPDKRETLRSYLERAVLQEITLEKRNEGVEISAGSAVERGIYPAVELLAYALVVLPDRSARLTHSVASLPQDERAEECAPRDPRPRREWRAEDEREQRPCRQPRALLGHRPVLRREVAYLTIAEHGR